MTKYIVIALMTALMTACGGGGGGDASGGGGSSASDTMSFSPSSLSSQSVTGRSQVITVTATLGNPSEFSSTQPMIEIVDSQAVLEPGTTAISLSGNTATATLRSNASLAPGTYQGNLQVVACANTACSSQLPGSPWNLPYNFVVLSRLGIADNPITASAILGSTPVAVPINIQAPGLSWGVSTNAQWMQPSVSGGTGSQTITLNLVPFADGALEGVITVNSADGQTVSLNVTLDVTVPNVLSAQATAPTNVSTNGVIVPPGIPYELQAQGLSWEIFTYAKWLQPNVSSGNGTGQFVLNFATAGLAPGTYSTNAMVTSSDGQSVTLPVSLTVYAAGTPLLTVFAGQINMSGSTLSGASPPPANGPAATATFYGPSALGVDPSGNFYVGDTQWLGSILRKISASGIVSTLAQPSNLFTFGVIGEIGTDSKGNVYFSDLLNETIDAVSPSGTLSDYLGGTGIPVSGLIKSPTGFAFDGAGNIYVANGVSDGVNVNIVKVPPGGPAAVFATLGPASGQGSSYTFPSGMVVDQAGNLIVVDKGNDTIKKISPAGIISILAGQPGVQGSADGLDSAATFNQPTAIAMNAAGDFYVSDSGNKLIRKVTAQGMVSTIAGTRGLSQFTPGLLPGALPSVQGLAMYGSSLYAVSGNGIVVISNVP